MSLTIAILTYKRPINLNLCLESIAGQKEKPDEVMVIDGDNSGGASVNHIIKNFKKIINLRYFAYKNQPIPAARNRALKHCRSDYLGFVDDDCVLDKRWVYNVKHINWRQNIGYVIGKSILLNPINLITKALFYRQYHWFTQGNLESLPYANPKSVDTKNLILNMSILKKHHIFFDESLYFRPEGDHSDTDFGLQFNAKGIKGLVNNKMIVYHQESPSIYKFIKKAYFRGKTAFLIAHKWGMDNNFIYVPDARLIKWLIRLKCWPSHFHEWVDNIPENYFSKIGIFLLIKLYDLFYLRGYVLAAKNLGVVLDLYEKRVLS